MGLHDHGHMNAPQCSNMCNYRVVTINKMAIVIQHDKSTANCRPVLLLQQLSLKLSVAKPESSYELDCCWKIRNPNHQ